MTKRAPTTAATRELDRLGLAYRSHPYPHDPGAQSYGDEAAHALGVAADRVFKTLVAEAEGAFVVGVVPVSATLDLKALAAAVGAKRAQLAAPAAAERRTGYVVGGISPIGQRIRLRTVVDASALDLETVFVSGGRRGFDVELAPGALLTATGGSAAPIAAAR